MFQIQQCTALKKSGNAQELLQTSTSAYSRQRNDHQITPIGYHKTLLFQEQLQNQTKNQPGRILAARGFQTRNSDSQCSKIRSEKENTILRCQNTPKKTDKENETNKEKSFFSNDKAQVSNQESQEKKREIL